MKKQDRQGVRTPADLERKYPFDKLSDLSKDYSSLRLEIMNALYDVSAELQERVNDTVEALETTTEAKIAEALTDYLKTGDFEAFEDAVTKDITALELSLESIREDLVSFEEEIDGWSAEIGILQGDVAELQGDMNTTSVDIQNLKTQGANLANNVQSLENNVNRVSTDLQGLTNDINTHFEFKADEGGLSIKGGLLPIHIPAGTDLDELLIPNKYISDRVQTSDYGNCPITTGTFSLDVESCGSGGQFKQTLVYAHKTDGKTYERFFYGEAWGEWVKVSDFTESGLAGDVQNLVAEVSGIKKDVSSTSEDIQGLTTEVSHLANDIDKVSEDIQDVAEDVERVSVDVQGVINDVNTHFDFKEGGLSIKGGLLPILIPANTDLDSLLIPNKYVGGNVANYNYVNCPTPSGTFSLEVESCGDEGQLHQRLCYTNKTLAKTFERYYYGEAWGEWVVTSSFVTEGKLLWQGVYYMDTQHTATLSEAVSKQKSGIVLVFSPYDNGTATNGAWNCHFVPKAMVSLHAGQTFSFFLTTSAMSNVGAKSLVINDANIKGHEDSRTTGDISDYMQFQNNKWVLRYVFGV